MEKNIPCLNDLIKNTDISIPIVRFYNALTDYVSFQGIWVHSFYWNALQEDRKDNTNVIGKMKKAEFDMNLKTYVDAFKKGYHNFEDDILNCGPFTDNNNKIQKIFDYAVRRPTVAATATAIVVNYKYGEGLFKDWPDKGKKAGYIYRAWCLIVQNHEVFTPLFEKKQPPKPVITDDAIDTPEVETIVNKYVLLSELGILQFLKDVHGFDEIKKTQQVALLSMILGLDSKGGQSIKGMLSAPRQGDKNYPLRDKNVNTVRGELTKLGIMKGKPVKALQKR